MEKMIKSNVSRYVRGVQETQILKTGVSEHFKPDWEGRADTYAGM